MNRKALAIVATLGILAACRKPAAEQKPVNLGTTPAVAATGLPELLVRRFTREAHVTTSVLNASDAALEAAARAGTVDVAIVNTPATVQAFRQMNAVHLDSIFAHDDYIIAGPRKDPAKIHGSKTAAEAFRKIVARRQRFCSPVDIHELHDREELIWSLAKIEPKKKARYVLCHGTAAAALDEAERLGAYTFTDRATIETVKPDGLAPLLEGTPMLHNDYTVVLLTPPERNRNAEWFVQWLMSYRGREVVDGYRFDGGRRFFLTEQP